MALRAQPSKPPVPQTFADMWKLVDDNYKAPAAAYSPLFRDDMLSRELLLAIFWEETFFTNKRQLITVKKNGRDQDVPEGPAIGFGQVEEPDTLGQVVSYFNNRSPDGKTQLGAPRIPGGLPPEEWTPKKILDDDDKAVQISILVFCKMWEQQTSPTLDNLLRVYAGWDAEPHPDQKEIEAAGGNKVLAWHNNRQALINGWKECRDKLFRIPERSNRALVLGTSDSSLQVVKKLINALNSSRAFCNLCYDAFDSKAFRPPAPKYYPRAAYHAGIPQRPGQSANLRLGEESAGHRAVTERAAREGRIARTTERGSGAAHGYETRVWPHRVRPFLLDHKSARHA